MDNEFRYYMHDGPSAVSFELAGPLSDQAARELDRARLSASSIVGGRSIIVDLSYVSQIGEGARRMLRSWYDAGAQLVARRPQSEAIAKSIVGNAPLRLASAIRNATWRPVRLLTPLHGEN